MGFTNFSTFGFANSIRSFSWRHPYGRAREECVVTQEQFLSKRQRYQPISLPQDFSDEELARDWT
jgi:hypothetical protein